MTDRLTPEQGHGGALTLSASDLRTDDAGEPRILDTDLAKRLGFDRPRVIRELIRRRRDELESYGPLAEVDLDPWGGLHRGAPPSLKTGVKKAGGEPYGTAPPHPEKGRKTAPILRHGTANPGPEILPPEDDPHSPAGRGFLLTQNQALTVAIMSEAPGAAAVRRMLVEAFTAFRKGLTAPAEPLPSLLLPMTPAVTVAVEIQDRAGLGAVRGREIEAPATKAAVRKATVGLFLDMYTVPATGSKVARKDLFEFWREYRAENRLPPLDVKDLFRLVAAAGYDDDGKAFHGIRFKMVPGAPPKLSRRKDLGSASIPLAIANRGGRA